MRMRRIYAPLAATALLLAACGAESNLARAEDGGGGVAARPAHRGRHARPGVRPVLVGRRRTASIRPRGPGRRRVTYSAPQTFDMVGDGQLIDAQSQGSPTGSWSRSPIPTRCRSIRAGVEAGIPVVSINAGNEVGRSSASCPRRPDRVRGRRRAGQQMAAAGVKNALCINQEVGNAALDLRCKGFLDGLQGWGRGEVLAVGLADPTDAQAKIAAALRRAATVDGILTLGPTGADPALAALEAGGSGDGEVATFDRRPTCWRRSATATCCSRSISSSTCRATCRCCSTQLAQHGLMPGRNDVLHRPRLRHGGEGGRSSI